MNITNFSKRLAAAIEYNGILELCKQNDYCLRSFWLFTIVVILISCLFLATALMVGCFIRDAFIYCLYKYSSQGSCNTSIHSIHDLESQFSNTIYTIPPPTYESQFDL